jgi:RING finger protein 170
MQTNQGRVVGLLVRARVLSAGLGTLLYVLSPLDLLPEAIFGLVGLVDDVVVACCFLLVFVGAYRFQLLRQTRGSG